MNKLEIIPAILPKDFSEVEEKIGLVKGLVKFIQIDVCDGQFVPNATWPYRRHDDSFEKIVSQEIGFPGWQDVNFEIDLMANKPEMLVQDWISAGASRIILHAESLSADKTNNGAAKAIEAIEAVKGSLEIGLALNIDTPIDVIEKYINHIQFIQCMGIRHIGFQGQDFAPEVIGKIREIKERYSDMTISVDGAVSLDNAGKLNEAGADRLVVGSAIFNADNPIEAVQKFKRLTPIPRPAFRG